VPNWEIDRAQAEDRLRGPRAWQWLELIGQKSIYARGRGELI
jgi:hypothetical protein